MLWKSFFVGISLVALGGCVRGTGDLIRRASFDMSCPERQIQVVDLGGGARGVTGCGHRSTYVFQCAATCENGTWLLNNATSGGEP